MITKSICRYVQFQLPFSSRDHDGTLILFQGRPPETRTCRDDHWNTHLSVSPSQFCIKNVYFTPLCHAVLSPSMICCNTSPLLMVSLTPSPFISSCNANVLSATLTAFTFPVFTDGWTNMCSAFKTLKWLSSKLWLHNWVKRLMKSKRQVQTSHLSFNPWLKKCKYWKKRTKGIYSICARGCGCVLGSVYVCCVCVCYVNNSCLSVMCV